jgi:hypothetical protein
MNVLEMKLTQIWKNLDNKTEMINIHHEGK